jgi:amino acid adenylation domain-containing protein
LSKAKESLQRRPPGKKAGRSVFFHLEQLLAHYGRTIPERHAILASEGAALSFGALRERVNDALRELRGLGVGRRDRVAVVLPNGPEAAVATIAVATSAVCVPLNPSFTADELQRCFGDLQIVALLTRADMGSASRAVAHALGIPVIDLSLRPAAGIGAFKLTGSGTRPAVDDELVPCADDDAFILLTSGTAARPKLVPLTHESVCRSAHNAGAVLQLGPQDRLLSVLPLFHAHGLISGLLTALAAGSSIVCTSGFDPAAFFRWLTEFEPTWYTAVPAIHRALLSEAEREKLSLQSCSLRVIRSASACLPPSVLGELESRFGVPVIETYGMTEAASQIAANTLRLRKPGSVGKSAGAEIAIMDNEGRRLAAGERGEIVLRGPTITRGYDNDIAATEAAFRNGWFRTGDLGYLDQDGYLFIAGRIKDVINRGGQKIAPAEVEEVLLAHPDLLEAVVFSVPHPRLGEEVAAAIVPRPDRKVTPAELRNFLIERLARFKIPSVIRIVREIPKGPSGKIRRGALASALSMTIEARPKYDRSLAPARSDLERQVASIWADLLELNQIGLDQNVFALGVDSLTVTQMLSRLRANFGVDLSFNDIFDAPTVAALAARLESRERQPAAVSSSLSDVPADSRGAPLSFQQQRIQVLSRLDPTGHIYHVTEVLRLCGPINVDALEASIAAICERHEVLRSTFPDRPGEPIQIVGSARSAVERVDMRPCAKSRRAAAIRRSVRIFARQSFTLGKEPPMLCQLLRLDEDDHALVVKLHHLITDGWSQRLFWEEFAALYRASVNGAAAGLPELPVQYRHFAEWQRAWLATPAAEQQRSYWHAQLAGAMEFPLRTDRSRSGMRTGHGARQPLKLSRTLSHAVKSLCRANGVTVFMALLAAFQCLLSRYTQRDDIAIGSVIANRNQIEIERLIGMFANTIVLRTDLSGDPTFSEVLRRVRHVTLDAYRNQDLPFEEVLRSLELPRSVDRNALFQVMFILHNPGPTAPALPGLSVRFADADPGIARVDLMLELIDAPEGLHGWFEYSTDLFEAASMRRMAVHLQNLLQAAVADPRRRISRLPLLGSGECKQVLVDWNETQSNFGPHVTLWERFAKQVKRTPDATAVSARQARLSYGELAHRSSGLADRLMTYGVGPDVVVILLAERSPDLLAAMIAVNRAGGAFLSLDPTIPPARLAHILQQSRTPLVLTGEGCAATVQKALAGLPGRRRPQILRLEKAVERAPPARIAAVRPAPSSLAYVIYTSGSTGTPKGAMIEQRGLLNHLLFKIADLGLSRSDVLAQTAPQSFDISVWQFLAALLVGGRVHICADEEARDPALLAQVVGREGVTVLQIVPALLRAILDRMPDDLIVCGLRRLRWLICIGEALPPDLCRSWLRHFPGVSLINAYGPAECSDTVAMHRLTAPQTLHTVPIGRPVANTRLYVLDAHLQPAPIGIIGELCVGGVCVGRGYLNDPEQTRRSFVCDPFSQRRGARLYRTGDLALWRSDGLLEFAGRLDHQVKIRGCRIELEEIERVLAQHSEVQTAVVLARDNVDGEGELTAYIVAARRSDPDANEIRQFLKSRLPEYMIPKWFAFLDRLPQTAHGKVDRVKLASMRRAVKIAASAFVAPRDSLEDALARIWADLLKLEQVGVFDNFFELGGHSLVAGRVLARIADRFGVSLPLGAIFEAPTVAALARRVREAGADHAKAPPEITPVAEDGPSPVSIAQEHILRVERALPDLPQFNLPFAYRLQGPLNIDALERSLAEVVRRHETLRMGFGWVDQRPGALVFPFSEIDSFFAVEDLAARAPSQNSRAKALLIKMAELRAEQEAGTVFEIGRPPLFRARLLRLGAEDHIFLLVLHHIIVDGWSIGVFMEELSRLYSSFAGGRNGEVFEAPHQFSEFVRWQRQWCAGAEAGRQLAHWKEHLRGASPVFSTKGKPGGAVLTSHIDHEAIHLPKAAVARLNALSHSNGATLFMTMLAAFKALLLAKSGRNDICVATAMANRSQLRTERVIGPVVNTTVIRTRIDADLSFESALGRVRASVLEAYSRQELPFHVFTEQLTEEDGLDPAALTQVYFVLQSAFRPLQLPEVTVLPFAYPDGQRILPIDRTWLSIALKETASGIDGTCSYKPDLFGRHASRLWVPEYRAILAKAAANPAISLGRLANL